MHSHEEDISQITSEEQKLLASKEALKGLLAAGKIGETEYREKLRAIEARRHKLHDELNDSIADMLFNEDLAPAQKTYFGQSISDEELAELIQIGQVVRGHIDDMRVVEVAFHYDSQKCKARITNTKGAWSFSSKAKSLVKGLFIRALEQDEDAIETFRHEIRRHPGDWKELVTEKKPGSFPRQILDEYGKQPPRDHEEKADTSLAVEPEVSHSVVIRSVNFGELPANLVRKKAGRKHGLMTVCVDIDGKMADLTIDTDSETWKTSASHLSANALSAIIPEMISAMEKPGNHIYLNRMISEVRRQHKLWAPTIKKNATLFPRGIRQAL